MKLFNLLPLLLASTATSLAVPALTSNITAPGTVQSGTANVSYSNTVNVLGYGGKNKYYEWEFDLRYEEFCEDNSLQARGDLFRSYRDHNIWTFEHGLALTYPLDDSKGENMYIFHDYKTSGLRFTYEDCSWTDNEHKNCGWCNDQAVWEGSGKDARLDCKKRQDLTRVSTSLSFRDGG